MGFLRQWLLAAKEAYRLCMPELCPICGRKLSGSETACCAACMATLPYTHLYGEKGNAVERLFWGQFPVGKASAWIYYYKGNNTRELIFDLKYRHRPKLGPQLGRLMATELTGTDFFRHIDCLIPVPLSARRLRLRGYNVCDGLAQGVSAICGRPVRTDVVKRIVDNPTQTRLLPYLRKENVAGIFQVTHPEKVCGRNLLLIDDLITTGATVSSCGAALADAGAAQISVLALAVSGHLNRMAPRISEAGLPVPETDLFIKRPQ